MSHSPARLPISDAIEGVVTRLGDGCLLSSAMLTRGEFVAAGELVIRYGIPYLAKPCSIVPDLVVLDYGDMLTGEAAWVTAERAAAGPAAVVGGSAERAVGNRVHCRLMARQARGARR